MHHNIRQCTVPAELISLPARLAKKNRHFTSMSGAQQRAFRHPGVARVSSPTVWYHAAQLRCAGWLRLGARDACPLSPNKPTWLMLKRMTSPQLGTALSVPVTVHTPVNHMAVKNE